MHEIRKKGRKKTTPRPYLQRDASHRHIELTVLNRTFICTVPCWLTGGRCVFGLPFLNMMRVGSCDDVSPTLMANLQIYRQSC